jgi:2-polyprenyl-3-methyl-5-hydroxy-6-metoxy-1,4-benzoquinol methylase
MPTTKPNESYTESDHLERDKDKYANAKYKITIRWLKSFLKPNQQILNIGCGAGHFNRVTSAMGFETWGFEPDATTFTIAQGICATDPKIHLENKMLLEIAPLQYRADALVMHDVLEHIEDDNAAVNHLRQLLKPAGVGIISVPAMPSLFGFHDEQLGHYRRYTKESLRKLLADSFVIEEMRYFGLSFIPIVYWFSVLKRKPYPFGGADSGLGSVLMASCCKIETHIPFFIGTSLLARIRPK